MSNKKCSDCKHIEFCKMIYLNLPEMGCKDYEKGVFEDDITNTLKGVV